MSYLRSVEVKQEQNRKPDLLTRKARGEDCCPEAIFNSQISQNSKKTMAIVYAVTKCKNPKYPDTEYLSCKARNTGTYDFDDLAEDIAWL